MQKFLTQQNCEFCISECLLLKYYFLRNIKIVKRLGLKVISIVDNSYLIIIFSEKCYLGFV